MEKDKLTAEQTRMFLRACHGERKPGHIHMNCGDYMKLLCALRINGREIFDAKAMALLNAEADAVRI